VLPVFQGDSTVRHARPTVKGKVIMSQALLIIERSSIDAPQQRFIHNRFHQAIDRKKQLRPLFDALLRYI